MTFASLVAEDARKTHAPSVSVVHDDLRGGLTKRSPQPGSFAARRRARPRAHRGLSQRNNDVRTLYDYSLVAFGAMAVLPPLLGWVVAGKARPLRTLSSSLRLTATNLRSRLTLGAPDDELKELGTTFNQLLDRLERSFESQRRFVATPRRASHPPRPPASDHQVALSDPGATLDSPPRCSRAGAGRRSPAGAIIDALLTLSLGEAGLGRQEALDLAAVVRGRARPAPRRTSHRSGWVSSVPSPLRSLSVIPAWSSG